MTNSWYRLRQMQSEIDGMIKRSDTIIASLKQPQDCVNKMRQLPPGVTTIQACEKPKSQAEWIEHVRQAWNETYDKNQKR